MRYWVLKGKPWNFDVEPGPRKSDTWHSGRLPKNVTKGDRLFIWQSSPALCLVALADLRRVHESQRRKSKLTRFDVRYRTKHFDNPLKINILRQYRSIEQASFLKSGPFATVYPLTENQGKSLYRIAALYNPDLWDVWPDIGIGEPFKKERPLASSLLEPPRRMKTEVTRVIRDTPLARHLKIKYGYCCQVCGTRIELGTSEFYVEVHHIRPLGGGHNGFDEEGNMIVVCPNHHTMFDYGVPKFLSANKITIGRKQILLTSRHPIDERSIRYHNKNIHKRLRMSGYSG